MADGRRPGPAIPSIRIESGGQIPPAWGEPHAAMSKATVSVREPRAVESFDNSWGRLSAIPGVDLIVVRENGEEYPVKRAIFAKTYAEVAPGRYRKTAASRLVQVPEGIVAVLATLEGDIEVAHPDYIAIGPDNEVYANDFAWVAANLAMIS